MAIFFGYQFLVNRNAPAGTGEGTNFIAQFLPFGKSTKKTPPATPPADVSGFVPESTQTEEIIKVNINNTRTLFQELAKQINVNF